MIYVVAPTYQRAVDACREMDISPHDRNKVYILTRADQVRGRRIKREDEVRWTEGPWTAEHLTRMREEIEVAQL